MKHLLLIILFSTAALAQTPVLNGQHPTLFLGDSITASYNLPYFFGTDKPYFSFAFSGKTCAAMADDWTFAISSIHPSNMVIWCGTNDIGKSYSVENAELAMKALIDMARSSKMGIVVLSLWPPRYGYAYLAKMQAFNAYVKAYVASLNNPNIVYVDLYSMFAGSDGYICDNNLMRSGDPIHPSVDAYRQITPIVATALAQVKK